jgi:hypothetical protein
MTREEINEEKQKEIFREQNKDRIKKISKKAFKFIFIILILGTLFFTYTTYISTVKVSVREYRITNKKIPTSFNGLKILQFSDLHYGTTMTYDNLKKIVKQINERKPDIVVFTGDLISDDYDLTKEEQEKIIKQLNKIDASLGKYAITGNEDDTENSFTTIFNQSNFTILNDDYELIYKDNNNPILLVGISNNQNIENAYSYFKEEVYNKDIYTITLVHKPDTTDDILDEYNSDLILAGHSHNGNIQIPFINYPLITKEGSKKYNKEYYKINNTKLYISSGLGTNSSNGIRLFCRPTMNLFRLSSE